MLSSNAGMLISPGTALTYSSVRLQVDSSTQPLTPGCFFISCSARSACEAVNEKHSLIFTLAV